MFFYFCIFLLSEVLIITYSFSLFPSYIQNFNAQNFNVYLLQKHYLKPGQIKSKEVNISISEDFVQSQSIHHIPMKNMSRIMNNLTSITRFDVYNHINPKLKIGEKYNQFLDEESQFSKLPTDIILPGDVCYLDGRTFTTRYPYVKDTKHLDPVITDAFGHLKDGEIIVTVIINLKQLPKEKRHEPYYSNWTCLFTNPSTNEIQTMPDMYPDVDDWMLMTKVLKCKYPFVHEQLKQQLYFSVQTTYHQLSYTHLPFCVYPIPSTYKYFMSTCVIMLQQSRSEMIKWLLYKQYQGFEHVTIYANEQRDRYYQLLRKFIVDGFVDVIDWNFNLTIPFISQESQLADCIHRNQGISKYMSLEDVDEFFQPAGEYNTIREVVQQYDKKTNIFDGLLLQNWFFKPYSWYDYDRFTFFNEHWPFDTFNGNLGGPSPPGREKIIIITERGWTMSPHRLHQGRRHITMSPFEEMRLVHYKWFFSDNVPVEDNSMAKYAGILQEQYDQYIEDNHLTVPKSYFAQD